MAASSDRNVRPRLMMGGLSPGEGGWRMVPLSDEQSITCHVPFTASSLGPGAWPVLVCEADDEGVRMTLRGQKVRVLRNHPDELAAKLAVYGPDPEAVNKWFLKVHDAAIDAGCEYETFRLPEQWERRLSAHLTSRVDLSEEKDVVASSSVTVSEHPKPKIVLKTLGIRYLKKLPEFYEAQKCTQLVVEDFVKNFESRRADPGADRTANMCQLLGVGTGEIGGIDGCFGNFTHDPEKETKHLGLSFTVQELQWKNHQPYYRKLFQDVQKIIREKESVSQRVITIVVYCRSGRHRSVTAAEILKAVLEGEGYDVVVNHVCDYWWRYVPCQKDFRRYGVRCPKCVNFNKEVDWDKRNLYDAASVLWNSVLDSVA